MKISRNGRILLGVVVLAGVLGVGLLIAPRRGNSSKGESVQSAAQGRSAKGGRTRDSENLYAQLANRFWGAGHEDFDSVLPQVEQDLRALVAADFDRGLELVSQATTDDERFRLLRYATRHLADHPADRRGLALLKALERRRAEAGG